MRLKRYKLKKRTDKRGLLVQNDYPEIGKKIEHFLVTFSKPGVIRGNHYHKRKREWFYILEGRAKLYLYNLKTNKKADYVIDSADPELIEMEPNIVHAIENIGDTTMIFLGLVNERFDSDDPDTYFYKIK